MKALLVEDDTVTRHLLERIVQSRGYEAAAFPDAETAWVAYQQSPYPLVLLDWVLPGMDGLELCRRMRALPYADGSVIVVLTARDRPEDLQLVLDAGADDYLTKPIDVSLLTIRLTIAERQLRNLTERKKAEAGLRVRDRAFADSVNGIVITDARQPNNPIIYANPAFERLTGYSAGEAEGRNCRFLHGTDRDQADLQEIRAAIAERRPGHAVLRNYRKDGTLFWNELSVAPVHDETGMVTHFVGLQNDITQRKQAEARLAEMLAQIEQSNDDLRSILNQLRIGSAMTDEHGGVVFVSEMCRSLFGITTDVTGQPWDDVFLLASTDAAQVRAVLAQPAASRHKLAVHVEAAAKRHHWVEVEIQDDPRDPQRKIFLFYDVSEVHDLRRLLNQQAQFQDLIGKSEPMLRVYEQIREVADLDTTVLIEGDTGTGKELVARAIHFSSRRKAKPFIAVNCAGLTDALLGSQLFGHKRGAFTGAVEDHKGLFEAANGGTIFLDEIGDVPPSVQTSLLRVLQEREIVRLGESTPRKIDVRVLTATHHNLAEDVAKGTFRSDLLYRIRVARIHLPALRQRREDIPLLVGAFLGECSAATGKHVEQVSNDVMRTLLDYEWPGNVRELRSAIECAIIRCKGAVIECSDLPDEILATSGPAPAGGPPSDDERQRLMAALQAAKGNRVAAARLLGISRATLYRRLSELHIPAK